MNESSSSTALKDRNFKWLLAAAGADVLLFLLILAPSLVDSWADPKSLLRAIAAVIIPVVVLFAANLISPAAKASLVYWRGRHALPGHQAFSVHAAADARVDLAALRRAIGPFPSEPAAQNQLWYRLYREVAAEPSVAEAHRHFLLFRDIAAMSVVLLVIAAGLLLYSGATLAATIASGILLAQYAGAAVAAQQNGVRFVRNVLAIAAGRGPEGSDPRIVVTQ